MNTKRVIAAAVAAFLVSLLILRAEAGADLITAVARNDAAAVQGLLNEGADANASAANGNTALMLAASLGHEGILKTLLVRGAAVDFQAKNGATALMLAAVKGHTAIVQALLDQRAGVNAKQERGWTALMFASDSGRTETALTLIANGAQLDVTNKDKETALMLAARNGHTEVVEALLRGGADPNEEDGHGWSALVRATWEGHVATKQALLGASPLAPAEQSSDVNADELLRSRSSAVKAAEPGTDPVFLRVTVTGRGGRLITNLASHSFKVFEDNKLQRLVHFEHEEAPVSIGILVDDSSSMRTRLRRVADLDTAVAAFLQVADPDDEFFAMSFNSRPQLLTGFTRDRAEILRSLASTQLQGKTALLDGIYLAIAKMREAAHSKQVLLVISDGEDTTSRYSERELTRFVREGDVQIYCIRIPERERRPSSTKEEFNPPYLLNEVAARTGGTYFQIASIDELPYVAAKIGVQLRTQYALTYVPANQRNERDNELRRVEVKLAKIEGLSPMRAYYRTGYYATYPRPSVPLNNTGDRPASP